MFGLSFERPYFMTGVNVMCFLSVKSMDLNEIRGSRNPQFSSKSLVFEEIRNARPLAEDDKPQYLDRR